MKKITNITHLCSVLAITSVIGAIPAFAQDKTWGTEALELSNNDTWTTDVDKTVSGKLTGNGTVKVHPSGVVPDRKDTELTIESDISEFSGKFFTQVFANGEGNPNANATIRFKKWSPDKGLNLSGNGDFIFDGQGDVLISSAELGINEPINTAPLKVFLNGNTLKTTESGNLKAWIHLGGIDDTVNGVNAKLSGYKQHLKDSNFYITGRNSTVNGDLNADVSDSEFKEFIATSDNSHVSGDVNINLHDGFKSAKVLGLQQGVIDGDVNINAKGVEVNELMGNQFAADGDKDVGIKGNININVEDSTIGNLRSNTAASGTDQAGWIKDHYVSSNGVSITVKNSLVKEEIIGLGNYLTTGDVKINILGNTEIGYDTKMAKSANGKDGWIIAGAQRKGGRAASTEVNLDTQGAENKIRIAGDVQAGSREKSDDNNSDEKSVVGDATLNMLGGGTIEIGKDVRAYHVGGKTTLNIADVNATVKGTVKEFQEINLGGTAELNAKTLEMNAGDVFNITLKDNSDYAKLTVDTLKANGADLNIFLTQAGEYDFFNVAHTESDFTWNLENTVYDLTKTDKGISATLKSVEDIASDNGLTTDSAQSVAALSASSSETLNDISVQIQSLLASDDVTAPQQVEEAVNALNPEKASVVQSTITSVQNTVATLASDRMAVVGMGHNGGDVALTGGSVWAQGLYNKTKMNGQFNGYTRGVSAGADGIINQDFTVGLGYAFNHTDVNPYSRDIEIDSHSVFVYGQYKPSDWYVNTTLNYTLSDYDESGHAFDIPVSADYKTNAFGGNITTGYNFAGGITPELGLRYLHVNEETYTNNLGIKNKLDSVDYLTAVLGTKYGYNFLTDSGVLFRPELRYAVKYDMLSDETSASVAMPGVAAYTIDAYRLPRLAGEFGVGLAVNYRDMNLSLTYDIEVREDYTSQTGMLKFKYDF